MKSRRIESFLATRKKIVRDWNWWSRFLQRDYYGGRSEIVNWDSVERSICADLNIEPGMSVLDLGSGSGELEFRLAMRGVQATGIEHSQLLVDECRQIAAKLGVLPQFICADMFEFEPEVQYNAVLLLNTSFGYGTDEQSHALIGKISRWLKPGGHLYLDLVVADYAESFGTWSDYLAGGTLIVDNTWDETECLMISWPYWLPPEEQTIYAVDVPERVRIYSIGRIEEMLEEAGFRFRLLRRAMGRHMTQEGEAMLRTWIATKEG